MGGRGEAKQKSKPTHLVRIDRREISLCASRLPRRSEVQYPSQLPSRLRVNRASGCASHANRPDSKSMCGSWLAPSPSQLLTDKGCMAEKPERACLRRAGSRTPRYLSFWISMLPLELVREREQAPMPILPERELPPTSPVAVMGRSVLMRPKEVWAVTV